MDNVPEKRDCKRTHGKAMTYFKEYCECSGIHGFRYIAEDRTPYERILWIISLLLSIIFCGLMIYQILQKYINTPVVVTFSLTETPTNQIPFPAVTICPTSKISPDYFNITAIIIKMDEGGLTKEEKNMYKAASTIYDIVPSPEWNITSSDFYKFLYMSKLDFFFGCGFSGIGDLCDNYFTPTLTDEGLCYTFNALNKSDMFRENTGIFNIPNIHVVNRETKWDIEKGYENLSSRETYPFRSLIYGAQTGLLTIMRVKESDMQLSEEIMYEEMFYDAGFKVALHLPSKIPELKKSHFLLPLNQKVIGQITPRMIITSDGVKAFSPSVRQCYFTSEKSLKYFKIYTQESCLIECKADFFLNTRGCVEYYMPRYNDTPICIHEDDRDIRRTIERTFILDSTNVPASEYKGKNPLLNCDCPPVCTDITYDLEISQNTMPPDTDSEAYATSQLILYFKKNVAETRERSELYGFSDLISNFGGLLGLFTGFSMLSLVEIIYFLSLRIWGNVKLHKDWSGNSNSN